MLIYVSSIRRIGKRYKLSCMDIERYGLGGYDRRTADRGTLHSVKLQSSLSRSKRIILEYGLCNDWDYFVTLTLDPKRYQRDDLKRFKRDLGQFIRDYNKRKMPSGERINYLFVPELHSDGVSWHMHGLIHGLPTSHLSDFVYGVHPIKLCNSGYRNWLAYEKKFGFVSLGVIRDKTACAYYMTKYITKDLVRNTVALNDRVIYASHGLKRPEYVMKNQLVEFDDNFVFDYANDYCRLKTFTHLEDVLNVTEDISPFGMVADGEVMTWKEIESQALAFDDVFEDVEKCIFDIYHSEQYRLEL